MVISASRLPWNFAPSSSCCGRLARAVGIRGRGHAVGRAAAHHVVARLARIGIGQRHDDHAVMLQRCLGGEDRQLGAAMLGRGRRHHGRHLVDQRALDPQRPGLVEEVLQLRGHQAEARRDAEDEAVIILELQRIGDRRLLVELVVGRLGDVLRHQFLDPLDRHRRRRLPRALGGRFRHLLHVAPARIVEHQNLRHRVSP